MEVRLGPGQRLAVRSRSREAIEVESTWDPRGTPGPTHLHPEQEETFRVLEGVLTVELERARPIELVTGEQIVIPAGAPHRMWNASDGTTRASWRVEPALRTLELWQMLSGGVLQRLLALVRFRREFRLARMR